MFSALRFLSQIIATLALAVWIFAAPTAGAAAETSMAEAEAQELFRRANTEYQKQNFQEARTLYQQLVEGGIRSPDLWFNLANASARLGRTGEAVLFYEKARLQDPRDPDIAFNLQRVAPPGNDPKPFVLSVPFHWLLHSLSLREWMGIFLLFYFAAGVLGAVLLTRMGPASLSRILRPLLAVTASVALVCGIFAGIRFYQVKGVTRAIVMRPETVVRSGPGENFSQLASAPVGTKVRQLEFGDDPKWRRVSLPAGQTGYTLAQNLSVI